MKTAEWVAQWRSQVKAELELLQHCSAKTHALVEDEHLGEILEAVAEESGEAMRERCGRHVFHALKERKGWTFDTASHFAGTIRALPLPGEVEVSADG